MVLIWRGSVKKICVYTCVHTQLTRVLRMEIILQSCRNTNVANNHEILFLHINFPLASLGYNSSSTSLTMVRQDSVYLAGGLTLLPRDMQRENCILPPLRSLKYNCSHSLVTIIYSEDLRVHV